MVLSGSNAFGQWRSDSVTNTKVVTATNIQQNPKGCSDGSNGAIIVWEDYRYGDGWDIFAQRLDANGVKMWADSGVRIARATNSQSNVQIVSDDSGGAYIAWEDNRSSTLGYDIYAQRVRADGTLAYAANGIAIGTATRDQRYPSLCTDASGGAYVAWEDSRTNTSTSRPDIYMNRLTRTGAAWGSGRGIITLGNQQKQPRVIDDGMGGCLLTYQNTLGIPPAIYGTRVSSGGNVLWGTYGTLIFRGASQSMTARNVSLARDGNQFLAAWEVTSASSSLQDIYAQRINMDSSKEWFSAAEVTGEWPGDQINPKIMSDDSGGVIVLFEDFQSDFAPNFFNYDISAVRVVANGVDRIPTYSDGFAYVSKQTRGQVGVSAVKLSNGGFIAAWDDGRQASGDTSIYAQRMERNMKRQWPVANTTSSWGIPLSASSSVMAKQVSLIPRANGAIAVFADNRTGNFDIYAQLVFRDATLPIELASFDVRANEFGEVTLDWKTASEIDNAGFEVERREISETSDNKFVVIANYNDNVSLRGNGSSSTPKFYSYSDQPAPGNYEYRIADVGLDGTRTPHSPKRVAVGRGSAQNWSIGNSYPNPAVNSFKIPLGLVENCEVVVSVKNTLGQVVYEGTRSCAAGPNVFEVQLPEMANGGYIYQVSALVDGNAIWTSPAQLLTINR
ncbi:MAG TPA: hypothetical protein VFH43_00490 [Candidatus Kapabacteria bacterium]|nr:hypothetical protein [Candidatus Kapabacteria bacterium]